MHVEGLVLAGGASRRMGQNKLVLPEYPGSSKTILSHVIDTVEQAASRVTVLVPPESASASTARSLGSSVSLGLSAPTINFVPDAKSFHGPLEAMAAAWPDDCEAELIVVAAGDLPGLHAGVLMACIDRYRYLMSRSGTSNASDAQRGAGNAQPDGILIARHGIMQPLLGIYRAEAGCQLKDAVANGERRLMRAVSGLQLDLIDSDSNRWPDWWTRPVHTPDDYQDWLRYRFEHEQQ